ncbi:ATP-dependent helicase [Bacillus subtilis]|nr:ATP-dependent helicase [Bacillus subtilis]
MLKYSEEQVEILSCPDSLVVLANPGSGKTFTISSKIRSILPELPEYQGIIAISYTNKASDELKSRTLKGNTMNKKSSFFGTIDKFFLNEIIYPFASHLFTKNTNDFEIIDGSNEHKIIKFKEKFKDIGLKQRLKKKEYIDKLRYFYERGEILIDTIGSFAVYILQNSIVCQKYMKAKYTHIFIDEYQDCGEEQHEIFINLQKLGLNGVAVGDPNQSIFGFSNKSAKYLLELVSNKDFRTFNLTKNYRCHEDIINYSLSLFESSYNVQRDSSIEKRVFKKKVNGSESDIAKFIDAKAKLILEKYNILNLNSIGVLVRSERTGSIIDKNMMLGHKFFRSTPLDSDSSLWAGVFKKTLHNLFDPSQTAYEFAEEYFDMDNDVNKAEEVIKTLNTLKEQLGNLDLNLFIKIANLIYPKAKNDRAVQKLQNVLSVKSYIESYIPAKKDQIQIMTLHKSKGLEFDIVFHLDLYSFVMPQQRKTNGVWEFVDYSQCLNLHYVGVTRAKEVCILCTSTLRTNKSGITTAKESEFWYLVN